jgi:hypothetical protein
MQKMYPRTNPAPFEASANVIPAPQIEEALRESVRQNSAHMRHEPENTSQVVTDVNSLVQRVADVSLDQLDDAIVDLRQLRDFLQSEGERIQRKSPAICSSTTLRSAQQKVLSITSCNGKRRRIVPRSLPSEAISWAQHFRRRRPRQPPKMSLSRRNDLAVVAAMAFGGHRMIRRSVLPWPHTVWPSITSWRMRCAPPWKCLL